MNLDDVFLQIANENKTTPQEIKKLITAYVHEAVKSDDMNTRHLFSAFINQNQSFTAEDVVMHIADLVLRKTFRS